MDILSLVKEATNGVHDWEKIPFSDHHGWSHSNWFCNKCKKHLEHLAEKDLPLEGCECKGEDFVVRLIEEIEKNRAAIKKAKKIIRHCKMFIVENKGYHQTRAEEVADITADIHAFMEQNP